MSGDGALRLVDRADSWRAAGCARTLAEHTVVHRAQDLEVLWTA